MDKHGQTIDFLLTEQRDERAAKPFLAKAIRSDPDNQRAFLRHINLAHRTGNEVMAKTFVYQWVKTHPGDTTTARLYQEYLDTGEFPDELAWENITQPPTEGAGSPPGP